LSLTWLAKKKMQGEVEFRRHYTAKLRRKLRRNYGETTAKLRRNYGETTAKLRRNYGESFESPESVQTLLLFEGTSNAQKGTSNAQTSGNVIYLRGVLCIERATSMQQRGGKGVGGVPGSASIFSSRALRS
jgi:hypothetical protein